ncbi:MurR/RpiR family transcriptional regulator [Gottfriedia luciferensis]|uniref:MurR/RpiR family transcriptional regulator n=1 Tax=Gottfriedia luciferensis TaxID=178774 RepID=UPI001ABF6932|nr:MurR/RpiR family transcriptional regulator [Gottfriedia luciferensis]
MNALNGGLIMLKEMLYKLPPSERRAAKYIIENPEKSIQYTVFELAEKSQTSNSAIIRLCRSLGLKGFQELKLRINGDIITTTEEGARDIHFGESTSSIIKKMMNNNIQAIKDTSDIINVSELDEAVEALRKARNIYFFGVGGSMVVALDAQQKFLRIKKYTSAFTDLHMLAVQIANHEENDVLVGISFSGETVEVQKALQIAKENGVSTISITGFGSNAVSNLSDIKLFNSPNREATFRSGATSSRMAQLHVIDILFMAVATQEYDQTIQYIDQTRTAISSLKSK